MQGKNKAHPRPSNTPENSIKSLNNTTSHSGGLEGRPVHPLAFHYPVSSQIGTSTYPKGRVSRKVA